MAVTDASLARAFKPEDYGKLIDSVLIDEALAFNPHVATTVRTAAEQIRVPLITADPDSAWLDELDTITPDDPTLSEIVITPKAVKALTIASNESVGDASNPQVTPTLIGRSLARSIGKKVDSAFLSLSAVTKGPQHPIGTVSYSYVDTGAVTAIANLDYFLQGIKLAKDNGANPTAIVVNPAMELQLRQIKQGTALTSYLLDNAKETFAIGGVPVLVSRNVDALTAAWIVDSSQVISVLRQNTTVVADTSFVFDQDGTAVRAVARWDVGFPNPAGVVRLFDHA